MNEKINHNDEEASELNFSRRIYHRLFIVANNPTTEIYVADTEGNLVVKATGKLDESLAEGFYDIHFGIKGEPHRIHLTDSKEVKE